MALRLDSIDEYFDPTLILPVPGRGGVTREYRIPEPSGELGLWCQRVASVYGDISAASTPAQIEAAVSSLNGLPELDSAGTLGEKVMGDAYRAMLADGVTHPWIEHAAGTVFAWIVGGPTAAERYWRSGGGDRQGEAGRPVPNRADRRDGSSTTTSTDAVSTTPSQASGTGTKSRKRSRRRGGKNKAG